MVISLDAEQIWGYLDLLDERQFCARYPSATAAYDGLLDRLCAAQISATWALVGGLSLEGMEGPGDPRLRGLPRRWVAAIPAGNEATAPLWYRRSFVRRLIQARPAQDVGLHGGLTHLVWTDPWATGDVIRQELGAGIRALNEMGVQPRSFIFTRQGVRRLDLLRAHGIRCYRGSAPLLSSRLRMRLPRGILCGWEEVGRTPAPLTWPVELLPGLWNIPASLSLYPIGRSRTWLVPLRTRMERFFHGLETAMRQGGMFHYWFHPDTLSESPAGFSVLDSMLERLVREREGGNLEVLTMAEVVERMEAARPEPLESRVGQAVMPGP